MLGSPSNVRSFPFTSSLTISFPSSIQAGNVERLQGRSEDSRLGHKLIAQTVYCEKVRRARRVALQFLS